MEQAELERIILDIQRGVSQLLAQVPDIHRRLDVVEEQAREANRTERDIRASMDARFEAQRQDYERRFETLANRRWQLVLAMVPGLLAAIAWAWNIVAQG